MARLRALMADLAGMLTSSGGRCLGCGILLLFLLRVSPGECIQAAALEDRRAKLCLPADNSTNLIYNATDPRNVTLCALVRPELDQPHNPATIISFYDNLNTSIHVGIDSFKLWVEVSGQRHVFEETLAPETWNPLCLGFYDNETQQIWAAMRGILLTVTETEEVEAKTMKDPGLCIGNSTSFVGLVAALSVQSGSTVGFAAAASNCSSLLANTEEWLTISSTWKDYGPVEVVEIEDDYLCSHSFHNVLLKAPLGYRGLLRICRSFSGYFPTEEDVMSGAVEVPTSELQTCTTDETHVSWVGSEATVAEGMTAHCPTMLANSTVDSRVCLSELECSICRVPVGLRFTLYGAIHDFDRYYYLKLLPDENIYFEGVESCNITKQGDVWVLRSRLHRRTWRLPQAVRPLGRRPWFSAEENTTLTLTSCGPLQFSSNDGVCLLRSRRCNGRRDSPDGSDEEGCQERLIRKEPNYDSRQSPYLGLKEKGTLMYRVYLDNVGKIKTEVGIANVQMRILLKWHDLRINFVDTRMLTNFISCKEIWHPTIGLVAGNRDGSEIKVDPFHEYCFVYWKKKVIEQQDLNDPFMGKLTTSGNINITQFKEIRFPIPCYFKVHRYPFGTYLCNATFYLVASMADMVWKADKKEESEYHLEYEGDHDLLDYYLREVTVLTEPKYVTMMLHLTGQFDYHLLNSFAPSALMFIICYSTLFFPITNFNERIMVSLTAMLVLAGLFAQATDTYIKTPYYKLLDIWYATLILFCFFVVIANAVVNSFRLNTSISYAGIHPHHTLDDEKNKTSKAALKCNSICKVFLLSLFVCLILLYYLFGMEVL